MGNMSSILSPSSPGPMHVPTPISSAQGSRWTWEETRDIVVLWGGADIQRQFTWGRHLNIHIYEASSAGMCVQYHSCMVQQCCVRTRVLQAQCVAMTNFNRWSGRAQKTMPFMWELTCILAPRETGHTHSSATRRSGLPSPIPYPDTSGVCRALRECCSRVTHCHLLLEPPRRADCTSGAAGTGPSCSSACWQQLRIGQCGSRHSSGHGRQELAWWDEDITWETAQEEARDWV